MNVRICQKCGKCCKSNIGAFIFPSDIKKISKFFQIQPSNFILQWCDENNIILYDNKIEVFTLKLKNGKCCFLDDNNLCKIFNCRPYQCINAPYNFLAQYSFWSHMSCVKEDDFIGLNSLQKDKIIFSELLNNDYKKYTSRR